MKCCRAAGVGAARAGEQPESRAPLTQQPGTVSFPSGPGAPRTHSALCEAAGPPSRPTGRSGARIPGPRFAPRICNRLKEVRIKIRFHGEKGGRDLETDTDQL